MAVRVCVDPAANIMVATANWRYLLRNRSSVCCTEMVAAGNKVVAMSMGESLRSA
ncbi:hypothetical protein BZL30_7797 [Mycobacterium kansasii]|uniref:Uncharacterized protein n=1 Tax=Mycobacterium kansasii TaxID=1768 RepID=A0A1V3WKW9_MYCKA|nr:hypothetical protein BZL30_7797 [Mycobacterium kansasii]